MQDFKELTVVWANQLSDLYSEREARNILLLALEDVFEFKRSILLVSREIDLSEEQLERLTQISSRLKTGEPYQYIVGFTYFDDLKIHVAPGVLIPRPETEELVSWIQETVSDQKNLKVEDWCTGSGCIALAIKNRNPHFEVIGYDISEEALEISRFNEKELNLGVGFEINDALEPLNNGKVDIIISNPPYIPWKEKEQMHQNVTEFEPDLALFVPNEDPLLFYRNIAEYAAMNLNDHGYLFFELHEDFGSETKAVLEDFGFSSIEIKEDLQGKNRMLKAEWKVSSNQ
ncbi:peptide chain release factor N(5)-glutamine methyltransferase [Fluviicola sp.]|uniref:peptide chain release factor N(5)-glutamine methyltransferase n=1 Tax=Fluviicola sp. TaxID=1917219 RepID=UPI003D26FD45